MNKGGVGMEKVLEVKGLFKEFEGYEVLSNINLDVYSGEFVAIMGRSGSGKSTLLYNISGMDRSTSGEIYFKGNKLSNLSDDQLSDLRLHHMGFIFQQSYLLKKLTIKDNIILPGYKAKKTSRIKVNQLADSLMEKTGIVQVSNNDIKKVSGGQLQRAAICRALINQPSILFGDEPTGALNSSTTREVMDIINSINNEDTTVVLVTHDTKVASRADRIIYLLDGKIHDELALGRYNIEKNDLSIRERNLISWLEKHGF